MGDFPDLQAVAESTDEGPLTFLKPDRWIVWAWLLAAGLLMVTFFLPNFEMAGMDLSGPKLIEILLRRDSEFLRVFDDAGFFMMVFAPLLNLFIAVLTIACGVWILAGQKRPMLLWVGILHLGGFFFAITTMIVVENSHSNLPFLSKLTPEPAAAFWWATVLEGSVFLLSCGLWQTRRMASPSAQAQQKSGQ